jgi:hypothetical protein
VLHDGLVSKIVLIVHITIEHSKSSCGHNLVEGLSGHTVTNVGTYKINMGRPKVLLGVGNRAGIEVDGQHRTRATREKVVCKNPPPQHKSSTRASFFIASIMNTPRSQVIGFREIGQS